MEKGMRVEIDSSPMLPGTGSGERGTVESVRQVESSVTGMLLRYTEVDVRLDNGSLLTRRPNQLRLCDAE